MIPKIITSRKKQNNSLEENKTGLERLLQFKRWKLLKPFLEKERRKWQ